MTEIKKTYKNYVDGKYVRSESGKTYTIELKSDSYELPLTSKKDLRDAVTSSKKGFDSWNGLSQYNKTQIIYRLSEMLEGNRDSYVELLLEHGLTKSAANKDIDNAINTIVWYAGLADKWEQLTGNLNPVDGEFFNISHQEPLGIVFILNSDEVSMDALVRSFLPSLSVGCSVVNLSEKNAVLSLKLAEDVNNSDLPSGSLNLLSGDFSKLIDDISRHVEINGFASYKKLDKESLKTVNENASTSVKRIFHLPSEDGLSSILPFIETKTVWHPKGR
ncbi:MAG: aldehyde dehydrogenase [Actinobacteria bacterium]|jgi:acyl-CoA reductase-like NAD-dependent aldehyde dehydrogenase|nr:aldehyde dehydrogenase [Actinomycetota bacterium]|tara:strand:- start:5399 stop:6226 length:828 start_codon:yes stop_codon:yes gene_type:complete